MGERSPIDIKRQSRPEGGGGQVGQFAPGPAGAPVRVFGALERGHSLTLGAPENSEGPGPPELLPLRVFGGGGGGPSAPG